MCQSIIFNKYLKLSDSIFFMCFVPAVLINFQNRTGLFSRPKLYHRTLIVDWYLEIKRTFGLAYAS